MFNMYVVFCLFVGCGFFRLVGLFIFFFSPESTRFENVCCYCHCPQCDRWGLEAHVFACSLLSISVLVLPEFYIGPDICDWWQSHWLSLKPFWFCYIMAIYKHSHMYVYTYISYFCTEYLQNQCGTWDYHCVWSQGPWSPIQSLSYWIRWRAHRFEQPMTSHAI